MEVQGKVKRIGNTETFGSNNFQKREIVVETDEKYPQPLSVEFVQDKCRLLDSFKLGESVKIGINLRGREWTSPQGETKYFNTIQGWRIEKNGMPDEHFEPAGPQKEPEDDGMPF